MPNWLCKKLREQSANKYVAPRAVAIVPSASATVAPISAADELLKLKKLPTPGWLRRRSSTARKRSCWAS